MYFVFEIKNKPTYVGLKGAHEDKKGRREEVRERKERRKGESSCVSGGQLLRAR